MTDHWPTIDRPSTDYQPTIDWLLTNYRLTIDQPLTVHQRTIERLKWRRQDYEPVVPCLVYWHSFSRIYLGEPSERLVTFKRWLWAVIEKMSPLEKQDLVYFWTGEITCIFASYTNIVYIKGSPALPASEEGFQPMPSVTIRPADDSHLPSANTCISRLYIPLYSRLIKLMIILYIDKLLFSANKYWKPNCYSLSKLKILDLCKSQSTIVKVERAVKVFYLYLNLNLWTIMWILLKQIFLLNWHFKYYYFFSFVLILYTKINHNLNESLFWYKKNQLLQ